MSDVMTTLSDETLGCPLCGYDLRGLTSRRCPECGHAFEPDALRAALEDGRGQTFEHAARPAIALVDTAAQSLSPPRFWRRFRPTVPVAPRRLFVWATVWLLAATLWSLVAIAPAAIDAHADAYAPAPFVSFAGAPTPPGPMYQAWGYARFTWLDAATFALRQREQLASAVRLVVAASAWPLTAFIAMRTFAVTLRRAGVRPAHLARVALYGWPTVMLAALVLGTLMLAFAWEGYALFRAASVPNAVVQWLREVGLSPAAGTCLLAMILLSTLHVVAAHARYLRLPNAAAQALLVALVSWLAIAALLLATRQML